MLHDRQIARAKERIKASIQVDENGCWLWQKTCARNGYGVYAIGGGNNARAHRISYEVFVGPIPAEKNVCHRCDVRRCVNPGHLFIGTQSENIRDAAQKGRVDRTTRCRGSAHPSSKLNDEQVRDILASLRRGETKSAIARRHGVSARVVTLIDIGEAWAHIERPAA